MKRNGFTLIEVLSAIVILGIIALIAVPSYSAYINSSRRSAYYADVKGYIESAKSGLFSKEYGPLPEEGEALAIPVKNIKLDKDTDYRSPFAMYEDEYTYVVVVPRVTTGASVSLVYDYYVTFLDKSSYGIDNVASTRLDKQSVKRISDLSVMVSISDLINGRGLMYDGVTYISCPGGDINNPFHSLCAE